MKEYPRRARQFVNGVILKCHDKYQETIAQELQTIHNRHEKHISQTQWAIAHEVGVQANENSDASKSDVERKIKTGQDKLQRNLPTVEEEISVRRVKRQILSSRFGTQRKFTDKYPLLNLTQNPSGKSDRSPSATSFDETSSAWNEEQRDWARHKAWKHHKEVSKINFVWLSNTRISLEDMFPPKSIVQNVAVPNPRSQLYS